MFVIGFSKFEILQFYIIDFYNIDPYITMNTEESMSTVIVYNVHILI